MTNLLRREWFIGLIAIIFNIQGIILPWYTLPQEILDTFEAKIIIPGVLKILLIVLLTISVICLLRANLRKISRLLVWISLILVLLFPYLMTTWSPRVSFIATSYYEQQRFVSDHISINFPEVQSQWKQKIYLGKSEPVTSMFALSIESISFWQIPSLKNLLINGFGYRDNFLALIGKGWGYMLIGLIISLMGLYLIAQDGISLLVQDLKILFPGTAIVLTCIISLMIWVNFTNYQLDILYAQGKYEQVVKTSKTLAFWYPPLQGNGVFLERWGKAQYYQNQVNTGLINFVRGVENYRGEDWEKAAHYFRIGLENQPEQFLIRGYLATSLINEGVKYINSSPDPGITDERRPSTAANLFREALQVFPVSIDGLYNLMLAHTINGKYQQSAIVAQQIIDLEKYFQAPSPVLLGQSYLHLAWNDYHNSDNTDLAWRRYLQTVDMNYQNNNIEEKNP